MNYHSWKERGFLNILYISRWEKQRIKRIKIENKREEWYFFCMRRSHRGSSRRENRKSYRGGRWSLPWKFLGCSQDILRPGREIPYPDACLRHFLVSTFHTTFEISKKYIYIHGCKYCLDKNGAQWFRYNSLLYENITTTCEQGWIFCEKFFILPNWQPTHVLKKGKLKYIYGYI